MQLAVTTNENLNPGDFVSLLFNDSNQVRCRKSLAKEMPDAVAARVILEGESIIFDTGRNTPDLMRPGTKSYYSGL